MRSVAKRLLLTEPTGTPDVAFTLLNLNKIGLEPCDRRCVHFILSQRLVSVRLTDAFGAPLIESEQANLRTDILQCRDFHGLCDNVSLV